jgi:RHS repeat-associated protein
MTTRNIEATIQRRSMKSPLQALTHAFVALALLLGAASTADAAKKTVHFYNDISGSPQMAVDADSGQVLWKENYKPYGERINNAPASSTGTGKNTLYFHGKQTEQLNGGVTLFYFGARYYDPAIGRFMAVDPVHFQESSVHSFNRFAYGNNNPYKFRDPDGRSPESPLMDTVVGDPQSVMVARGMMYFGEALTLAVPAAQLVRGGVALYRGLRAVEGAAVGGELAAERLAANAAKGAAFEQSTAAALRASGADVAEQITVRTASGTRTRLDMVAQQNGGCRLIECKSSATAGLTKNQAKAFPEIEQAGATVVGKGKPGVPGGTQIPPMAVEIVRP